MFLEGNVPARDAGVYLSGSLLSDGVEHLLVCPMKFCFSVYNQRVEWALDCVQQMKLRSRVTSSVSEATPPFGPTHRDIHTQGAHLQLGTLTVAVWSFSGLGLCVRRSFSQAQRPEKAREESDSHVPQQTLKGTRV